MFDNFLGIDCGLDGFIMGIDANGNLQLAEPTPTLKKNKRGNKREYNMAAMRGILKAAEIASSGDLLVVLEKQQAMPGQGVTSMFSTGRGFGLWEGMLVGMGLRYQIVHPRTWQKIMLRDVPGDNTKTRSILAAERLFPSVDLRKNGRCRTPHDGKADALLMAEYGKRTYA